MKVRATVIYEWEDDREKWRITREAGTYAYRPEMTEMDPDFKKGDEKDFDWEELPQTDEEHLTLIQENLGEDPANVEGNPIVFVSLERIPT